MVKLAQSSPRSSPTVSEGQRQSVLAVLERHPLLWVFVIALVVRVVVATVTFLVVHHAVIPDEQQYVDLAGTVASGKSAEDWATAYGQSLYDSTWVFTAPLTALFRVFWETRLLGQLLAALYASLAAVVICRTALEGVSRRAALVAGLIVALLPSQVLWSSAAIRESAVWLALSLLALSVTLAARRTDWRQLVPLAAIASVALLALLHLREQTMEASAAAFLVAVVAVGGRGWLLRVGGALAIVLFVPWIGGVGPGGIDVVRKAVPELGRTRTYLALDANSAFTSTSLVVPTTRPAPPTTSSDGGPPPPPTSSTSTTSTTLPPLEEDQSIVVSNAGDVYVVDVSAGANLRSVVPGFVAVALRPFPWEAAPNTPVLMARYENVLWYGLYLFAAAGVYLGRRRRALIAFPFLAVAVITGMAAVTQGNLGTSFRHRGQVLGCLALLAAVAFEELAARRARQRAIET